MNFMKNMYRDVGVLIRQNQIVYSKHLNRVILNTFINFYVLTTIYNVKEIQHIYVKINCRYKNKIPVNNYETPRRL